MPGGEALYSVDNVGEYSVGNTLVCRGLQDMLPVAAFRRKLLVQSLPRRRE